MLLTPELKARAQEIKQFALAHPYSVEEIAASMRGQPIRAMAGDMPELSMDIPAEFRVVYSVEDQLAGRVHHISMSIPRHPDRRPHPIAFEMVCRDLFEIKTPLKEAVAVWKEGIAINALFLFENESDIRSLAS